MSAHAAYLYDAMLIYADSVKECILEDGGCDVRNGTTVIDAITDRHFESKFEMYTGETLVCH